MKKLIVIFLSVVLVLSLLAACGSKEEKVEGSEAYKQGLQLLDEADAQIDLILENVEKKDQDAAMEAYADIIETLTQLEQMLEEMTEAEAEEINKKGEALVKAFQEKADGLNLG